MTATESWQEREARRKRRMERDERLLLRLEAANAQRLGIDVFTPGWRDLYLEAKRAREEEDARVDSMIATPHVDEAIDRMEEEFDGKADGDG